MKKALSPVTGTSGGGSKMHNTLVYMRQHWQLYVIFMLPAFLLTIIFRYIPMGGIAIAFTEYNPIRGIFASEWVGFEHFQRFLSSQRSFCVFFQHFYHIKTAPVHLAIH